MKRLLPLLIASCIACGSDPQPPEIPPGVLQVRFEQVPYNTTLEYVTDLAFVPNGSGEFLAIDLFGRLEHARLDSDGAVVLMSGRFEDVYTEFDAGQLGLALDPGFANNGLFYVATNLATNHVQIRRYTLYRGSFPQTRDSEVVIVDLRVSSSPRWHNISSLGFDEEGVMWALVGDKGLFEPAQDPTSLLGSLIRIIPSTLEGVGGYTTPEGGERPLPRRALVLWRCGPRHHRRGQHHRAPRAKSSLARRGGALRAGLARERAGLHALY